MPKTYRQSFTRYTLKRYSRVVAETDVKISFVNPLSMTSRRCHSAVRFQVSILLDVSFYSGVWVSSLGIYDWSCRVQNLKSNQMWMSCHITQFGNNMQMTGCLAPRVVEEFSTVLEKLMCCIAGVVSCVPHGCVQFHATAKKTFTSGSWLKWTINGLFRHVNYS